MTASGIDIHEARFFQVFDKVILADGQTATITGMPGSARYTASASGHRCHLGDDCRYHETQTPAPRYRLGSAWTCQLRPAIPSAPPAVERHEVTIGPARRTGRTAKPRKPMADVVRHYRTTQFTNGSTRRECWSAETIDGQWLIERMDDVTTPWQITHKPTKIRVRDWFGTLDRARAEIYRITHQPTS